MNPKIERIHKRLQDRALRIARLIELKAPPVILTQELRKFQEQSDKWHQETINDLLHLLNEKMLSLKGSAKEFKEFKEPPMGNIERRGLDLGMSPAVRRSMEGEK